MPLANISPKAVGELYNFRLSNQNYTYIGTNQLGKSKQFLKDFPPNTDADLSWYQFSILFEAITRKDAVEIAKRKKEFIATPNVFFISAVAFIQFSNSLSDELEATIKKELIARYQQEKGAAKARIERSFSNYIAWLMQQPDKIQLENLDQLPKAVHIYQLLYAGLTYIDAGQPQQLSYIIKELERLTAIEQQAIARFDGGVAYYALGILHTQLGQYEPALRALQQAKKYGAPTHFKYDKLLAPLADMPEFKELVKPIWPAVKG